MLKDSRQNMTTRKKFIYSFLTVITFLIISSLLGDKFFFFHPGRFFNSEWDKGVLIETAELNTTIKGVDDGRGLKIFTNTPDTKFRIKGLIPIDSNANKSSYPYLMYGDSIIKKAENDTFKVIRHDTTYIWKVEESSIK